MKKCNSCGKRLRCSSSRCKKCNIKNNKLMQSIRSRLVKKRLCRDCGKTYIDRSLSICRCKVCFNKNTLNQRRHYEKNKV
jgi:hypothetical protein